VAYPPEHIEDLAGEELGGVHFVRDYVEFYFDGPVVRSLSSPIVRNGGREQARFPAPGSRDGLCALIGLALAEAEVREEEAIYLRFKGGAEVVIPIGPLGGADPELVETAHVVSGSDQPISVW
jgi:hypothetical protein